MASFITGDGARAIWKRKKAAILALDPVRAAKYEEWRLANVEEAMLLDIKERESDDKWILEHPKEVAIQDALELVRNKEEEKRRSKKVDPEEFHRKRIEAWELKNPEEALRKKKEAKKQAKELAAENARVYREYLINIAKNPDAIFEDHPFNEYKWHEGMKTPRCLQCNIKCRGEGLDQWRDFEFCTWKCINSAYLEGKFTKK
jgi:hypothetical protein